MVLDKRAKKFPPGALWIGESTLMSGDISQELMLIGLLMIDKLFITVRWFGKKLSGYGMGNAGDRVFQNDPVDFVGGADIHDIDRNEAVDDRPVGVVPAADLVFRRVFVSGEFGYGIPDDIHRPAGFVHFLLYGAAV